MAGILPSSPTLTVTQSELISQRQSAHRSRIRCSSSSSGSGNGSKGNSNTGEDRARIGETKTPKILKLAVSGVTEFLRLFSSPGDDRLGEVGSSGSGATDEAVSIFNADDVVRTLKIDYENAYFVTGIFTSALYVEDCLFEDPTIRFRGTELYARNLKLLVPFFDHPSIGLQSIDVDSGTNSVLATWKLRTYLRFPWRPFISIVGATVYELNEDFKIVRHTESWNVSALGAVGQIFTPSFDRRPGEQ
ncbi:unnamed protein product [Linum trigynum]|uniref:Uncharacterized protein n=1 Tax=Linum trigynum TaxID=586398 RepID=A0AAV2CJ98_9ROSI